MSKYIESTTLQQAEQLQTEDLIFVSEEGVESLKANGKLYKFQTSDLLIQKPLKRERVIFDQSIENPTLRLQYTPTADPDYESNPGYISSNGYGLLVSNVNPIDNWLDNDTFFIKQSFARLLAPYLDKEIYLQVRGHKVRLYVGISTDMYDTEYIVLSDNPYLSVSSGGKYYWGSSSSPFGRAVKSEAKVALVIAKPKQTPSTAEESLGLFIHHSLFDGSTSEYIVDPGIKLIVVEEAAQPAYEDIKYLIGSLPTHYVTDQFKSMRGGWCTRSYIGICECGSSPAIQDCDVLFNRPVLSLLETYRDRLVVKIDNHVFTSIVVQDFNVGQEDSGILVAGSSEDAQRLMTMMQNNFKEVLEIKTFAWMQYHRMSDVNTENEVGCFLIGDAYITPEPDDNPENKMGYPTIQLGYKETYIGETLNSLNSKYLEGYTSQHNLFVLNCQAYFEAISKTYQTKLPEGLPDQILSLNSRKELVWIPMPNASAPKAISDQDLDNLLKLLD